MLFTVDNNNLQEALKVISRLAPPVSGNITIESDGKKLWLHSNAETSRCTINLPATVSGKKSSFAVAMIALSTATKGRKTLEIKYEKTLCKISGAGYKAELATHDSMDLDHGEDKIVSKSILSQEQAAWLKAALSVVVLKPTELISPYMPVSVRLTAKGAFVACYDANHMAFIQSKEITGDMEVRLPIDMMIAVVDIFHKSVFKLEVSESNLYVTNKLVKVVLSLPQKEDNELQLDEVMQAAKETSKSSGQSIEISKRDLLAFLDNARAVATKEKSEIHVGIGQGKIKMTVETSNGKAQALMKASSTKKSQMLIDFDYVEEAVRKSGDSVLAKLVGDDFVAFRLKTGTVVVAQNQAREGDGDGTEA